MYSIQIRTYDRGTDLSDHGERVEAIRAFADCLVASTSSSSVGGNEGTGTSTSTSTTSSTTTVASCTYEDDCSIDNCRACV
mmetsp:Transcript_11471/g.33014  ORF Transcript_11471/g.33014 Transcript_11471/m.33014 type:complete len:81 (+) Transcript_11471:912-1154(+)